MVGNGYTGNGLSAAAVGEAATEERPELIASLRGSTRNVRLAPGGN